MPDKTAGSDLHGHTHLNTNSKPTQTALKVLEIPHTEQVNNTNQGISSVHFK